MCQIWQVLECMKWSDFFEYVHHTFVWPYFVVEKKGICVRIELKFITMMFPCYAEKLLPDFKLYSSVYHILWELLHIIISRNLDKRVGAITKFYAWLENNKVTPVEIKLMILDNCLFSSMLHGVETWGDISCIEYKLIKIELKALKAILRVKIGTTNDLVLHEIWRCSIIEKIKDIQYAFYKKLQELPADNAIVSKVIYLCRGGKRSNYYSQLSDDNSERDISNRATRIKNSDATMCVYYSMFDFSEKSCIYSSFLNDYYRYILTRWRLSNHDLRIETGRRTRP